MQTESRIDYVATIRTEAGRYVARDHAGAKRTDGPLVDPPLRGRDLAEYLYHPDEIGDVRHCHETGETFAEILTTAPIPTAPTAVEFFEAAKARAAATWSRP